MSHGRKAPTPPERAASAGLALFAFWGGIWTGASPCCPLAPAARWLGCLDPERGNLACVEAPGSTGRGRLAGPLCGSRSAVILYPPANSSVHQQIRIPRFSQLGELYSKCGEHPGSSITTVNYL